MHTVFKPSLLLVALFSFMLHAKEVTIYSHGVGEPGPWSTAYCVNKYMDYNVLGPVYPSSLYTRPSVITLCDYLYDQVINQGAEKVHLVGRSCGSAIVINALAKLTEYEQNKDYFKDSCIRSQEDAQRIWDAVQQGSIELTCPLLHIEKVAVINSASKVGAVLSFSWILGKNGFNAMKERCARFIHKAIVPSFFKQYEAGHQAPFDALEVLAGKIKCPVLIQVCKHDGVVDNSPEDVAYLYQSLGKGNEQQTHIFVSTDAWHNSLSSDYIAFRKLADKGMPLSQDELLCKLQPKENSCLA